MATLKDWVLEMLEYERRTEGQRRENKLIVEQKCDTCQGTEDVYPDSERGRNECLNCAEAAWEVTYNKFHSGEYGKNTVVFSRKGKINGTK